jgi:hypothetical protein
MCGIGEVFEDLVGYGVRSRGLSRRRLVTDGDVVAPDEVVV